MILRLWRGRASSRSPTGYPRHFKRSVVPELRSVDGFLGATLTRRVLPDAIEFLVITRWRSMEAIAGFAGTDVTRAVVEPGAIAVLSEFDDYASHFEVIEEIEAA